jgi:hypothetical protein
LIGSPVAAMELLLLLLTLMLLLNPSSIRA